MRLQWNLAIRQPFDVLNSSIRPLNMPNNALLMYKIKQRRQGNHKYQNETSIQGIKMLLFLCLWGCLYDLFGLTSFKTSVFKFIPRGENGKCKKTFKACLHFFPASLTTIFSF